MEDRKRVKNLNCKRKVLRCSLVVELHIATIFFLGVANYHSACFGRACHTSHVTRHTSKRPPRLLLLLVLAQLCRVIGERLRRILQWQHHDCAVIHCVLITRIALYNCNYNRHYDCQRRSTRPLQQQQLRRPPRPAPTPCPHPLPPPAISATARQSASLPPPSPVTCHM